MISSPNELPNCVLWLDASDPSTMFQDVSVASTQRSNIFPMSETLFSNTRWAGNHEGYVQLSATNILAPNNTGAGTDIFYDVNNFDTTTRHLRGYIYIPYTDTYTVSFFAKTANAIGFRYIYISLDGVAGYVDLTTGSVSNVTGGTITVQTAAPTWFSVSTASSGWFRISITKSMTGSTTSKTLDIYGRPTNTTGAGTNSRTGVPFAGVAIWGMMVERSGTINSYIRTTTLQNSFADGSPTTSAMVPVSPSRLNLPVGYWRNKSLSATVFGLSGVHPYEENSPWRPTLVTTADNLTSVFFDVDYLSTAVLTQPISATELTVFAVVRWDNTIFSSNHQTVLGLALSGVAGHTDTLCYNPIVRPISHPVCSVIGLTGVELTPQRYNWLYRTPLLYNRTNYHYEEANGFFNIHRALKNKDEYTNAFNRVGNEYKRGTRNNVYDSSTRTSLMLSSLPSMSAFDVLRLGSTIDQRLLELRTGFGWATSNSFRDSGSSGNSINNKGQNIRYGEVIVYNRALTPEEIIRVENYLVRKWQRQLPRQVWALSDGHLSATEIFSISSEPAPFNVLLSSDIIYTNGYTLTASVNQMVGVVTNNRTPITNKAGGQIVMTQGVTLSASVIGGVGPYTVFVPSNTSCDIVGNIFGGGEFNDTVINTPVSAIFNPGVYIDRSGVLTLSGSIYGGFSLSGVGLCTDGGSFQYNNFIQGGGTYINDNGGYTPVGGHRSFGVSAINSNLHLSSCRIQYGLNTAGMFTNNCNVILTNCIVEARHDINTNNTSQGPANLYAGCVCYVCEQTNLSGISTMFIGATSTNITSSSNINYQTDTTRRHSGTALWATLSSNIFLSKCYIEGSRRAAIPIHYGTDTPNLGFNQAVRLSTRSALTGVSCTVNSARNSTITSESNVGKTAIYIEAGSFCWFQNSTLNAEPTVIFNRGIYNAGTLIFSGVIRGGYRGVNTTYPGIYNIGTLSAEGVITPNYSGSPAIDNESNGIAVVRGNITPGGPLCNTITSRGSLTAFYSEPLQASIRGFVPINAVQCVFVTLCSDSLNTRFSVDGVQNFVNYFDKAYTFNLPLTTDVLKDYVYGPNRSLTGVSIIPEISSVITGVPVRDLYGTVRPLTVDALWNQPITSVPALSTSVFMKFINPLTSKSLSAITESLAQIPPPGL